MDLLNKHINDLSREDWIELYVNRGLGLVALGKAFGVNPTTISKRLKGLGIQRKSSGRRFALNVDKETLHRLYVEEKKSMTAIAKQYGVSDKAVKNLLDKYGIKRRVKAKSSLFTKEYLQTEYVFKGRNATAIAKEHGVSAGAVLRALKRYGFSIRGSGNKTCLSKEQESAIVTAYKEGKTAPVLAEEYKVSTTAIYSILDNAGVPVRSSADYSTKAKVDHNVVIKLYVDKSMSLSEVADEVGVSRGTVVNILKKHNIPRRSKSEAKRGKKNNMYGVSHSKETRSKMSRAYDAGVRDISLMNGKGYYEKVTTADGEDIVVRSRWEGAVVRFFNKHGVVYKYEPKRIAVVVDGVFASYVPDFYVESGIECAPCYVEVKGMWKEDARKKIDAARALGHKIVVWEGKDLQKRGILDSSLKPLI